MKTKNLDIDFLEEQEKKSLTTSCQKCVFATKDGKLQTLSLIHI